MKNFIGYSFILGIGMALLSCSDSDPSSPQNLKRVDIQLSENEKEIASKQCEFPVKLLSAAVEQGENDNVMVSPLSAQMVLGMMTNAIDEPDRAEILQTLNLKEQDLPSLNSYLLNLSGTLPGIDKQSIFRMANGFWLSRQASLSSSYEDVLKGYYSSEIRNFDVFDTAVINEINGWVDEKTGGGIPRILNESDANPYIMTAWLNTIFFKGVWRQKFKKELTEKKPFYPNYPDESVLISTDMMFGGDFRYKYYHFPTPSDDYDDAITAVMLPYGNESYIFTAVLPAENKPDIASTLKELDTEFWQNVDMVCSYERNKPGDVDVYMPKIHNECANNMIPVFQRMGLSNIFNGISMEENLGLGNQLIGIFRQNVVLDLDEEGSEIKVVTESSGLSTAPMPSQIINFNRPFIYFVRERSTGAVILAGVYNRP